METLGVDEIRYFTTFGFLGEVHIVEFLNWVWFPNVDASDVVRNKCTRVKKKG
jgi:hypothetical protein